MSNTVFRIVYYLFNERCLDGRLLKLMTRPLNSYRGDALAQHEVFTQHKKKNVFCGINYFMAFLKLDSFTKQTCFFLMNTVNFGLSDHIGTVSIW